MAIGYEKWKWQFGLVFVLMKGKETFLVLKTDKVEVKVLIEEKRF